MRHIFCLTLLLLVASSNADWHQLTDIFHVDLRDPRTHFSSCKQRLNPNDPNSALYDPSEQVLQSKVNYAHKLNQVWYWANYLIPNVRLAIDHGRYEQYFDTRKLLDSFFAIKPGSGANGKWEPDDPHDLSAQKLVQLRQQYLQVHQVINRVQQNGPHKPMLFCDSTFGKLQAADAYAYDREGNKIRRKRSLQHYRLGEWEREHGRNFNNFWYFWMDFEGQRGYWVIDREDGATTPPWPKDPRTNSPSMCQDNNAGAFTWDENPNDDYGGPGTEAWLGNQLTILCPGTFDVELYRGDDRVKLRTAQPFGTHLDLMGITALFFLHELFHVARPDFEDYKPYYAKFRVDAQGQKIPDPNWPKKKIGFDRARHDNPNEHNLQAALQCMTLAAYESAEPADQNVNDLESLHDPETLAWFMWTLMIQLNTHQDWSTGAARPGGSSWSAPEANVPGWGLVPPPAGKIGHMTGPIYNSSDFGELWPFEWAGEGKKVISQWKNTTEAMGPITSFEELTTFVTSIRARL